MCFWLHPFDEIAGDLALFGIDNYVWIVQNPVFDRLFDDKTPQTA